MFTFVSKYLVRVYPPVQTGEKVQLDLLNFGKMLTNSILYLKMAIPKRCAMGGGWKIFTFVALYSLIRIVWLWFFPWTLFGIMLSDFQLQIDHNSSQNLNFNFQKSLSWPLQRTWSGFPQGIFKPKNGIFRISPYRLRWHCWRQ